MLSLTRVLSLNRMLSLNRVLWLNRVLSLDAIKCSDCHGANGLSFISHVQVCAVALEFRSHEASILHHTRLANVSSGKATAFDSEWDRQLQLWIGELQAQRSTIAESLKKVSIKNLCHR